MSGGPDRPPRLARALMEWLEPPTGIGSATGDLDEEYANYVLPDRGRAAADRWYWKQVVRSAPGLLRLRLGRARRERNGTGGERLLSSVVTDIRFAVRLFARRPAFTGATVATLTLGLGVNIAVFTVVNAVLVRPLPYAHEARLVRPLPDELFFLQVDEARRLGEAMTSLDAFAAWGRTLFLFTGDGEAEEVRGARVSWNHFDMLGAAPMLGRSFGPDDAIRDDAVILAHGLWVRRFGADPAVVGRTIDLYGRAVTVVGVMGPDHVPMEYDWEAWRPLPVDPAEAEGMALAANGRLRVGATLDEARAELRVLLPEIWALGGYQSPPEERAGLEVVPLRAWLLGDVRAPLLVLMAAVGLVLLLACANVASLLIGQAGSREREFAMRTALGGSRMRVARQRVLEVVVLTAVGGALALLASNATVSWFRHGLPPDMPRVGAISTSWGVIAFTVACSLVAASLTALVTALGAGSGRGASPSFAANASRSARTGTRSLLVAAEMALAVVLVIGAGLMMRSLGSLRAVDPGFDAEQVVTLRPAPGASRYPPGPELIEYYRRATEEIASLPGVTAVAGIQFLPMTPGGWWTRYQPEGRVIGSEENAPTTAMRVVWGDYFAAMRIPVLAGRALTETDGRSDSDPVAVVNDAFARDAFPGENAVGRSVDVAGRVVQVVGVVADVRQSDLRSESHPEMYIPFGAQPWQRMHLVARVDGDPEEILGPAAAAVRAVDAEVAILGPRVMTEVVGSTIGSARLVATLLTVFGLVGLGLGAVGVYGVTTQGVAERRREIGIRVALGARATRVIRSTVLEGLVPVVVGVVLGLGLAVGGTRLLAGLLFGVGTTDPATFLGAPALLVATAVLSLLLPAVRAGTVDPVRTLREE